jgi:uncharacterized hydrophobic protein (TIGR00271 family)
VLRLDSFVPTGIADEVGRALGALAGVRHVRTGPVATDGTVMISADVDVDAADAAIDALAAFGVDAADSTLWRVPGIQPLAWRGRGRSPGASGQVWAEIVGRADEHAQLGASYLVFMISAGIIAGIGVLTGSAVLIVGAMALSPDLLPISATSIGIVERRWDLAARALRVLAIGLAAAALGAFAATVLMRVTGVISDDLVLAHTTIGEALTKLSPGSLVVALTAGVAGMMAFERPGGAAVGVAISVTTIPVAGYVGAALAMGRDDPVWSATFVLLTNVVMVILASSVTLATQRRARRRRAARAAGPDGDETGA